MVGEIVAETGGIDILVNNAGGTFATKAEKLSANGWRAVIDLNLNGTFYCCRAVGRHMIERGRAGRSSTPPSEPPTAPRAASSTPARRGPASPT